jgi:hypothetical protein
VARSLAGAARTACLPNMRAHAMAERKERRIARRGGEEMVDGVERTNKKQLVVEEKTDHVPSLSGPLNLLQQNRDY